MKILSDLRSKIADMMKNEQESTEFIGDVVVDESLWVHDE